MTKSKTCSKKRTPQISLLMLKTQEIGAAEFKARCLELMDEVERSGTEIIITKYRQPVARLVPARVAPSGFCGSLKSMIIKHGDIVGPTGLPWEADESNLT